MIILKEMGCAPIKSAEKKKSKNIQELVSKQRDWSYFSRFTMSTISGSTFKMGHDVKVKCLRFKIIDPAPKFAVKSLDLGKTQLFRQSLPVVELIQEMKKVFVEYTASYRRFCDCIHDVCIDNFEFVFGLKVMMLSILANKDVNLNILSTSPYIRVQGDLHQKSTKILKTWELFTKDLNLLLTFLKPSFLNNTNKLKDFCQVLTEYSEFVLKPHPLTKAKKLIESCIHSFNTLSIEANSILKDTEEFFSVLDLQSIKSEVDGQYIYSGKQIVHSINS